VSVNWNDTNGTAIHAPADVADFVYKFETVTFAPGEKTKSIFVEIIGDTTVETPVPPNEYFFVNILSTVNGQIDVTDDHLNHAVVTIDDDESGDPGPWYVEFSKK